MSEEFKRITIVNDGKSYAVSSEKGFDRLLTFFSTSYLEHVDTHDRVFDSISLVSGGTYRATVPSMASGMVQQESHNSATVEQPVVDQSHDSCQNQDSNIKSPDDSGKKKRRAEEMASNVVRGSSRDITRSCSQQDSDRLSARQIRQQEDSQEHGKRQAMTRKRAKKNNGSANEKISIIDICSDSDSDSVENWMEEINHNLYQRQLEERKKKIEMSHAIRYIECGDYRRCQSDPVLARHAYEGALEIRLKYLGDRHKDVASVYTRIGKCLFSDGKYDDAMESHQKALDILLALRGERHGSIALSYSFMGNILFVQNKHEEARKMHERALDIRLEVRGNRHFETAMSYNNIGCVLQSQAKYEEAMEAYRQSLDIALALGNRDKNIAGTYRAMGAVLTKQNKHAKARVMYEQALSIYMELFGEGHKDVVDVRNSLELQGERARA